MSKLTQRPSFLTGCLVVAAAIVFVAGPAWAANVTLDTADGFGSSSFNSAGGWSSGSAPSAGNDYFVSIVRLRTPADAANHTFQGDSLTIQSGGEMMSKNSGARTTSANFILDGGTIVHGSAGNPDTLAGVLAVTANGGLLWPKDAPYLVSASVALTGTLTIDADNTTTLSGNISGNGGLTVGSGGSRVYVTGGTHTHNGVTTIDSGSILEVNVSTGVSSNSDYTVNGLLEGWNNVSGFTIGALNGSGSVYNNGSPAGTTVLTVGGNGNSGSFSGVISDSSWSSQTTALTKIGGGTQTLSGANTYSGNTTVNAGTLRFGPPAVLHMSFDNVSGSTVYNDGSGGASMDGTLNGTASVTSGGKFGDCLAISGADAAAGSCRIADSVVPLNVGAGNTWTVSMWIKTSTAGGCYAYQGDGAWGSGNTTFYCNPGSGSPGTKAGGVRWGQGWETGTATVNDGAWHHVVLVCNGTTKTAYVDGSPDALSPSAWSSSGTGGQFWIGGAGNTGDGTANLNGNVDEVYVFDRVLSQSEVQTLYNDNLPETKSLPANATLTIASGATVDVSSVSFTLEAGQTLQGSGVVTGTVTAASGSAVVPGMSAGILTFTNDLTMANGTDLTFELSTSASSGNDQIIVAGDLALSSSDSIHIDAIFDAADLDETADYVLFQVGGTTTMATTPSLVWDGTAPGNAANFSVTKSAENVVLRYTAAAAPTVAASLSTATAMRNQEVTITAVVTAGSGSVTSVVADASAAGGPVDLDLALQSGSTYTNTFRVGSSVSPGVKGLTVTVWDDTPLSGGDPTNLTVIAAEHVWDGEGADDNWSTNPNWTSDAGPASTGDSVTFAGSTRLTPSMDADYTVTGLSFDATAGTFTLGTAGSTLNNSGGIVNNSANAQTVNVPMVMTAAQSINAASGDVTLGSPIDNGGNTLTVEGSSDTTLSGDVSGSGKLSKTGAGTLNLSGATTYEGDTEAYGGVLNVTGSITGTGNGNTVVGNADGTASMTVSGAGAVETDEFVVGNEGGATTGTVSITGGSVTATDWMLIGRRSGHGTVNQSGGTVTHSGASDRFALGWHWGSIGPAVGIYNLSGNAVLNANAGTSLNIGASGNDEGTMTVSDSATFNAAGHVYVGRNHTGSLSISGGDVNISGNLRIAESAGVTGTYTQTGGTNDVGGIFLLSRNSGTVGTATISGGELNCVGQVTVGHDGAGTLNVQGGLMTVGNDGVRMTPASGATSIVNLDGGTLRVPDFFQQDSGGTATIYLNGGELEVSSATDDLIESEIETYVKAGGAIVDTAGFDKTFGSTLLDGGGGGGLTKTGAGTLTLTGSGTGLFTGSVLVDDGTLYLNPGNRANNNTFSFVTDITVTNGATLQCGSNGPFGWDGTQTKPITVHAGCTLAGDANTDVNVGTVTLKGGTLAGGPFPSWGGVNLKRSAGAKLIVTDDSTVTVTDLGLGTGNSIDVAAGKTLTISGTINDLTSEGTCALIMSAGTGKVILTGANNYTDETTVNAGTLQLGNGGASGSISPSSAMTIDGTLIINRDNAVAQGTDFSSGVISGTGSLVQDGSGTTTLNQPNSYSGTTTVNAGKLVVSSAQTGTGAITVADGTELGVTVSGANQLSPTSLTLGTAGSLTLEFSGISSTTTAPLNPGSVTRNASVTLDVHGTGLTAGNSYPLIANAGSTTGYTLNPAPLSAVGVVAHLDLSGSDLVMVVDSVSDIWTGAVDGNWDILTTTNWNGNASLNTPAGSFADGDTVLFDDTVLSNTAITVAAHVSPGDTLINNSSTNYSITSSGANNIGGAGGLTKSGTGELTLSGGLNQYSGATTINGGMVNVSALANGGAASDIGASGNDAANLVIDDATLKYTGTGHTSDRLFTLGSSGATLDASGSGALTLNNAGSMGLSGTGIRTLTLTGSGTGAVAAVIGDQGGDATSLTKSGAGAWALSGASTYSGGTTLSGGQLNINGAAPLGSGTLTINGGTTIDNTSGGGLTVTANNPQSWNGDFTFVGTDDLDLGAGAVTLGADRTVTVNANTLTVGGVVGGAQALTKAGAGTLTLAGVNTYSGQTRAYGGTLNLTGTIPGPSQTAVGNADGTASMMISGSLTANEIVVGNNDTAFAGPALTGTVTMTAGSAEATDWFLIGRQAGHGTFNQSGGTVTHSGPSGRFALGWHWQGGKEGTVGNYNLSGNAALNANNGSTSLSIGASGSDQGAMTVADSATFNAAGTVYVGNSGTGALTLSGGDVNISGSLRIAESSGVTGTYTQSGGTNDVGGIFLLARNGGTVGTATISGGELNVVGQVTVGHDAAGTLNVQGGLMTVGNDGVRMAAASSATSIVNLDGGTLRVPDFFQQDSGGTATIYLDGGELEVSSATDDLIESEIETYVEAGGAVIDTAGFDKSLGAALLDGGGGAGLTKLGAGTLTLTGGSTYTGTTAISAGTLALGAGGSIDGSSTVSVSNGAVFDVSAISYTLPSGQTLTGNGVVTGDVAAAAGSGIAAGASVGTLSFSNNVTLGNGTINTFELSTSAAAGNDGVVVRGDLTLSSSDSIRISALSGAADLDETADYVLFQVAGTTTMATTPSLAWDGTPPDNYRHYTVTTSGNNVVLHYNAVVGPLVSASLNVATAMRNQEVTITAVVMPGSGAVTSVVANVSAIGGSAAAPLTAMGGNTYEGTFTVAGSTSPGVKSLSATVYDNTPLSAGDSSNLTVIAAGRVWDGDADTAWTNDTNWVGDAAPGESGDGAVFNGAGNGNTAIDLGGSVSVTNLHFDTGAAVAYTIGTGIGDAITLTDSRSITMSSNVVNDQEVAADVAFSGGNLTLRNDSVASKLAVSGPIDNDASAWRNIALRGDGDIELSGSIGGADNRIWIDKYDGGTATFSGSNPFAGSVAVHEGGLAWSGTSTTVDWLNVGDTAGTSASLDVTGGTLGVDGTVFAATTAGATGTVNVTDGTLSAVGDIRVSSGGSGVFNQSSGTVSCTGWFVANRWNGGDATYNMSGGTVNAGGNAVLVSQGDGPGTLNVSGGTFNCNDVWVSECYGGIAGIGTLTISGTGVVNPAWWVSITRNNAAAIGVVNLDGGTLNANHVERGPGTATINFNGGTLQPSGNDADFIAGAVTCNVEAGGAVIDTDGSDITIARALLDGGGGGGMTKQGAGTLTLTAVSTFTGATVIEGGTLALTGSGSMDDSPSVTVSNGAVFDVSTLSYTLASGKTLAGGGTVSGSVTAAAGSSIVPGGTAKTLTFGSDLILGSGTAATFELSTDTASGNDRVAVTGNLTLDDSDTIHISAISGAANLDAGDYVLFQVGGTLFMASKPSLVWDGVVPANAANYTIETVGQSVVLQSMRQPTLFTIK